MTQVYYRRLGKWLGAAALLGASVFPAAAWNSLGHRAVAELAWRKMSPAQRDAASAVLQHHPHYNILLTAEVPPGVDKAHWAFLTAAVWPDLIRPAKAGEPPKPRAITKYNVYPHGVELPFLLRGDTNFYLLKQYPAGSPRAQSALAENLAQLKSRTATPRARAVSVGWVLHLGGDLHQPLHCANLVTKENPKERSAGGQYLVRNGEGKVVSLHALWDQLPGADLSYDGVMRLADALAADSTLRPAALPEYRTNRTIASWVRESHQLAVDFAYAPERVQFVHAAAVKSGKTPESAIPQVSAEYLVQAQMIARRRLMLAALRLADALPKKW